MTLDASGNLSIAGTLPSISKHSDVNISILETIKYYRIMVQIGLIALFLHQMLMLCHIIYISSFLLLITIPIMNTL